MDSGKDHADGRRVIGGLLVSGAHVSRNIGIQADAGSHCQGKGLDRENDGNSGECVAAETGNEDAVHDVVQRLDQHGDHRRNRHFNKKREHAPFPGMYSGSYSGS